MLQIKKVHGGLGDWQTFCHRDKNIALCVAKEEGVKRREGKNTGSLARRSEAPVDKQSQLPCWGQAGYRWHLTHHQPYQASPSFQASALLLLFKPLLPSFPPFHVYSLIEHLSTMCQTQRFIVCSRSTGPFPCSVFAWGSIFVSSMKILTAVF